VIPPNENRKEKRARDFALYRERNLIERFNNKIKHFRAPPVVKPRLRPHARTIGVRE
jgi:transposase